MRAVVDSVHVKQAVERVAFAALEDWGHQRNRVRLTVEDANLVVEAFSGDMWSRVWVPATVWLGEGSVVVPSRPFQKFIRNCPDGAKVEFNDDRRPEFTISSGSVRMKLGTFPPDSWLSRPSNRTRSTGITPAQLDSVRQILYAAHHSDPVLQCVRWGDGHVMASDHYRLAMCGEALGLDTFLLPVSVWRHILKNYRRALSVRVDRNVAHFETERAEYVALRVVVPYSDRARLVRPKSRHDLRMDKAEFRAALAATAFMDEDRKIRIEYHRRSTATLHSQRSEYGQVRSNVAASGSFDGTLILDVMSLNDLLAHTVSNEIHLGIDDVNSPVVVIDGEVTHVVVPYER